MDLVSEDIFSKVQLENTLSLPPTTNVDKNGIAPIDVILKLVYQNNEFFKLSRNW